VGKPTKVTNSIRALRFAHGEMTQAELAGGIGVTRQTIIAIEQGRYSPSLEVAFQIARVFKVELAVHPADGDGRHQLYLMCGDIHATLADLQGKGAEVAQEVSDEGWGLLASVRMPDGSELPIYEPRHLSPVRPLPRSLRSFRSISGWPCGWGPGARRPGSRTWSTSRSRCAHATGAIR
jgi:putative transcriptional regulator